MRAGSFRTAPPPPPPGLARADRDEGVRPGPTSESSRPASPGELSTENEVLPGSPIFAPPAGKMMYPLVRELAEGKVPVTVAAGSQDRPATLPLPEGRQRAGHRHRVGRGAPDGHDLRRTPRDPEFAPVLTARPRAGSRSVTHRVAGLCGERLVVGVRQAQEPEELQARHPSARRSRPSGLHRLRAQPALADRHHRALDGRRQALPLRGEGRVLEPDRRLLDRLPNAGPPARGVGARQRGRSPR